MYGGSAFLPHRFLPVLCSDLFWSICRGTNTDAQVELLINQVQARNYSCSSVYRVHKHSPGLILDFYC